MLGSFSIGYVNTDRFFKNSELSKRSAQKLKDEFKSRESELSGPFAKMSADYDQKKRQFDEDLDKRKKQESAKVLDIANQAIKEISKTDGIDLVLQKAIYIAPEFDITDKVISVVK
jgi:outer membrane protein